MRRFQSTASVRLATAGGEWVEAWVAESLAARLIGLAFLPALLPGCALLLPGCRSVHTAGMRFPIDVAFMSWPPSREFRVMAVETAVPPWRVVRTPGCADAVAALEAGAHTLISLGMRPGARVVVAGLSTR